MGGHAMHEQGFRFGLPEEVGADPVGIHQSKSVLCILFTSHADPNISVDYVGILDRFAGVRRVSPAWSEILVLAKVGDLFTGLVLHRATERDFEVPECSGENPGVGHIAGGVSEEGDLLAFEPFVGIAGTSGLFEDGHAIGIDLARMKEIGQCVDHGNLGVLGELLDDLVTVGSNDQTIEKTGEHLHGVRDAFPSSNLCGILV